jgi:hypothetical protein
MNSFPTKRLPLHCTRPVATMTPRYIRQELTISGRLIMRVHREKLGVSVAADGIRTVSGLADRT